MPFLVGAGLGALGGIYLTNGFDNISSILKWGVIGSGIYIGAKALKVI